MPSFCTCVGCGNAIGCSGSRPCELDAPLYADSTVAAAARARNPGITVHFRLFVIAPTCAEEISERIAPHCECTHKAAKCRKKSWAVEGIQVPCLYMRLANGRMCRSRMRD